MSIIIDEEEFVQHPIYSNYCASKNGKIYNSKTKKILTSKSPSIILRGYDKSSYTKARLIYEAFYGIVERGTMIHKNNDSKDNRLENLDVKYW